MRPVFADPKTDFVFKRIFGAEAHKDLLIALLNNLLELDEAHKIVDLKYLTPEPRVPVEGPGKGGRKIRVAFPGPGKAS